MARASAPALRRILDALFLRPSQQLVLRLKSPAAVGRVAIEGQVEWQAVSQKLDAALKSPVAVAEGPEHGGGVSASVDAVKAQVEAALAKAVDKNYRLIN